MNQVLNLALVTLTAFTINACGQADQVSQVSSDVNSDERVQTFVGTNKGGECGLTLTYKEQKITAYKAWGLGKTFSWEILIGKYQEKNLELGNPYFQIDKPVEFTNPFNHDTVIRGVGYFNEIRDPMNIVSTTTIVLKGGIAAPKGFSVSSNVSAAIVIRGYETIDCKL